MMMRMAQCRCLKLQTRSDQIFAFKHVVVKNVEGIDITSLEIRDTIYSTHTKYYVDPNNDGNHQEIYKPDPNADWLCASC